MKKIIPVIAALSLAVGMAEAAITTGPEVGSTIPGFKLMDQAGREQTFAELSGPNGLLLLFHRTADW